MHRSLLSISYDLSPASLGISAVLGVLVLYTFVKMLGFSTPNQFVVEGRVSNWHDAVILASKPR